MTRTASLLLAAALLAAGATAKNVTILPLGDSITHGCGSTATPPLYAATCTGADGGYRYPLLQNLTAEGIDVLFVGSQTAGPSAMPSWQRGNEGHPGWRIGQLTAISSTWLAYKPEVILLHAGTNDVGQNHTLAQLLTDMSALLTVIQRALPNSTVFLASILNMVNSQNPQWMPLLRSYNAALPSLAARYPPGFITFVDVNGLSGLCDAYPSVNCCNCNAGAAICPPAGYDRVHPTGVGYQRMAAAWAQVLVPHLQQRSE